MLTIAVKFRFFDLKSKGENRNLKANASLVQHHSAPSAASCLKLAPMNPYADGEGVVEERIGP